MAGEKIRLTLNELLTTTVGLGYHLPEYAQEIGSEAFEELDQLIAENEELKENNDYFIGVNRSREKQIKELEQQLEEQKAFIDEKLDLALSLSLSQYETLKENAEIGLALEYVKSCDLMAMYTDEKSGWMVFVDGEYFDLIDWYKEQVGE